MGGVAERHVEMSRREPLARRVVITGLGATTPAGVGRDALWRAIVEGRSCECLLPQHDHFEMNCKIFAIVPGFDPIVSGLDLEVVKRNDRVGHLALVTAREAFAHSGLDRDDIDPERAGVNIGTAVAGSMSMESAWVELTERGTRPLDGSAALNLSQAFSPVAAAIEVARDFGFQGPVLATSTGCTAGLDSIGQAWRSIRDGEVDVMIAGASEAPLTPIAISAFDTIQAITRKPKEAVGTASSPFSADRDGFILSEGCGLVVLEELEHAQRRGATILAEILFYASTSNAYHMTGLPPDGLDLARAIALSIEGARIRPSQIDYVNAHGSSTLQNDRNETAAFHLTLGANAAATPVSSLKSILGHPLGAASSIEIVASVQSMLEGFLIPTINYRTPAEDCDLDYVPNHGRAAEIHCVLSDCSGFSGLHSSIVLTDASKELQPA